jgi:hypothetical protein
MALHQRCPKLSAPPRLRLKKVHLRLHRIFPSPPIFLLP